MPLFGLYQRVSVVKEDVVNMVSASMKRLVNVYLQTNTLEAISVLCVCTVSALPMSQWYSSNFSRVWVFFFALYAPYSSHYIGERQLSRAWDEFLLYLPL